MRLHTSFFALVVFVAIGLWIGFPAVEADPYNPSAPDYDGYLNTLRNNADYWRREASRTLLNGSSSSQTGADDQRNNPRYTQCKAQLSVCDNPCLTQMGGRASWACTAACFANYEKCLAGGKSGGAQPGGAFNNPYAPASATPYKIRVFDRLGQGQISDTVTITIGGIAQTINLTRAKPSAFVQFTCPHGDWPFSIQSTTSFYNQAGKLVSLNGQGFGTVTCTSDGDAEIAWDPSRNPAAVWLQSRTQ